MRKYQHVGLQRLRKCFPNESRLGALNRALHLPRCSQSDPPRLPGRQSEVVRYISCRVLCDNGASSSSLQSGAHKLEEKSQTHQNSPFRGASGFTLCILLHAKSCKENKKESGPQRDADDCIKGAAGSRWRVFYYSLEEFLPLPTCLCLQPAA